MSEPISESGPLTNLWRDYVSPVVEKLQSAVQDWHCERNSQDETCQLTQVEPIIHKFETKFIKEFVIEDFRFKYDDYLKLRKSSKDWQEEALKTPVMCLFCMPDTSRLKAPIRSTEGADKP